MNFMQITMADKASFTNFSRNFHVPSEDIRTYRTGGAGRHMSFVPNQRSKTIVPYVKKHGKTKCDKDQERCRWIAMYHNMIFLDKIFL